MKLLHKCNYCEEYLPINFNWYRIHNNECKCLYCQQHGSVDIDIINTFKNYIKKYNNLYFCSSACEDLWVRDNWFEWS